MRVVYQYVIGTRLAPFEDQTPLLIDPDVPCVLVELQIVARRHTHEPKRCRRIQLGQLAHCHIPDVGEPGAFALREQLVRIRASEGLDRHRLSLYRLPVIGIKERRANVSVKLEELSERSAAFASPLRNHGVGPLLPSRSMRSTIAMH